MENNLYMIQNKMSVWSISKLQKDNFKYDTELVGKTYQVLCNNSYRNLFEGEKARVIKEYSKLKRWPSLKNTYTVEVLWRWICMIKGQKPNEEKHENFQEIATELNRGI